MRHSIRFLMIGISVFFVHLSFAEEAPTLSAKQSIVISAPVSKVWEVVSDFGGLHNWLTPILDTQITLGKNRQQGAIRLLTRANGTKVEERLIAYDPIEMSATYTYVQGRPLAADYISTMKVTAVDGGSKVEWSATFRRLDYWSAKPTGAMDDEKLTAIYNKVYTMGLSSMKEKIESGQI